MPSRVTSPLEKVGAPAILPPLSTTFAALSIHSANEQSTSLSAGKEFMASSDTNYSSLGLADSIEIGLFISNSFLIEIT